MKIDIKVVVDTEGRSYAELTDTDAAKLSEHQIKLIGDIVGPISENLRLTITK